MMMRRRRRKIILAKEALIESVCGTIKMMMVKNMMMVMMMIMMRKAILAREALIKSVCSIKIITSHFRAERRRCQVSPLGQLWPSDDDDDGDDDEDGSLGHRVHLQQNQCETKFERMITWIARATRCWKYRHLCRYPV